MKRAIAWIALVLALCADAALALDADDLKRITPAAEGGSAASQVLLAVAYLNGDGGLAKDPAKAAYWFEQAAIRGNAYAEERLGDLYAQGLGVPANAKLAFDWRIKAANRGIVQAQVKVGKMYQEGVGVGKNIDQAIHWFHRAAAEGDPEAQFLLGKLYHYGGDVEVDRAAARSWFEKAAQQGYEGAVQLLNLIESVGYQIDEGWHNRLPELRKLADDGDLEAEYQLALRYERGIGGVKKDIAIAVDWYRRAAAGGHQLAKRKLAGINSAGADGATPAPEGAPERADRPHGVTH